VTLPPLLPSEALTGYLDNPDDARIAAVTDSIRGRCGWHIAPSVTDTITVDGTGTRVVALPSLHVTDVDRVTERGASVDVEWNTIGLLRHPHRWTSRWRAIEVTFTHGYAEVPADLVKVVAEAALRLPDPGEAEMTKIGPFELASTIGFLPDELEAIDRYRLLPNP
jgi:hypothetical protein